MVQGTIITSYCLQGQLLISHLNFLRAKLLQHTMPGLDWMKVYRNIKFFTQVKSAKFSLYKKKILFFLQEMSEFKKLLKYFNDEYAPAVCIYTVVNISWAISGTFWLLWNFDKENTQIDPFTYVSVVNVILWISISIAPFIQVNYKLLQMDKYNNSNGLKKISVIYLFNRQLV